MEDGSRKEEAMDTMAARFAARLNVDAPVFVPNFGPPSTAPNNIATNPSVNNAATTNHTSSDIVTNNHVNAATEATPKESPSEPSTEELEDWEKGADEEEMDDEEEFEDESSTADDVPEGAEALPADIKPKSKRKKKVSECSESEKKDHWNVVFIGHVDAGKSTIGGQILNLTGMVDKRTLEKYEREAKEKNRESWYLSWALDTNQEERDKGKTVEVGRAFFTTQNKHFTLLDAPGHKGFVPNMICGACQADLAVLVISARKGEFETGFERGGQTREHAMLAKTAGCKHMVVLINKMDDPTVNWSEERYNECKDKLTPYLKKCGFGKNEVYFMPCSGYTGAFIKDPPPDGVCPWYTDKPFLDYIDSLPPLPRPINEPFRMPLVDKYKDMGTVVLGKVESGSLKRGAILLLMPNRKQVEVLQLWTDEDEVNQISAGQNVKVKLKGVEEEEVSPGFVLCDLSSPCSVAKVFVAQVAVLEHKSIICKGYSAVLHIHCAVEEVVVQSICLIDKKTGEKTNTRFIKQDQVGLMRLECQGGLICMETFDVFPQMARITLRDEGKTVAIGKVLKVIDIA